jgi:RNA 2',3'-cyclic 3'-phosphodiesterase
MREPAVRSFVALELDPTVRAAVADYLAMLRSTIGGVAWSKPEQLHVTLKFLGNVAEPRIPALTDRLRALAGAQPPFTLEVRGVGAFPSVARPRVVWVGIRAPAIAALASGVDRCCGEEGIPLEARPFHPHVTLGRVREDRKHRRTPAQEFPFLAADGAREFGTSSATHLVLMRSDLGKEGARHTPLATLKFD